MEALTRCHVHKKLQQKSFKFLGINTNNYCCLYSAVCAQNFLNPFAPELPVTARADPRPFYPL